MDAHERRKLDVPQQIETKRLLIRILHAGDGKAVYEAVQDSFTRLSPWLGWVNRGLTEENYKLYVRNALVQYYNCEALEYGIFLKEDDALIGRIGIFDVSWNPIIREFGYWMRTGYEGKGYMSEAVQALIQMVFMEMKAHKIVIRADRDNEPSKNVALRNGFTYEGTARHFMPKPLTGEMSDLCFFSLLRREWEMQNE